MNEMLDWDDFRLFLAVARSGGLAGAAPVARASTPTLSRRMTAFERTVGMSLFVRRRDGYDLTGAGKDLLRHAESVERAVIGIERWRSVSNPNPVVKIAAGGWTSAFLARHLPDLIDGDDQLSIEILSGAEPADLLRREANLGLRNRRPETPGLAGQRLARVEFAIYGEAGLVSGCDQANDTWLFTACRWIVTAPPGPKVPSAVWLDRHLLRDATIKCSTTQATLEAARAGCGLCILPCFTGDAEPGLSRASGVVAELGHDQWLVSHDDDRHDPHIRRTAKRLAGLIRANAALFRGDRPA